MSVCRSCGAPIRWVQTEAGKAMPVDPVPVASGNLIVDHSVDGPRGRVDVVRYATAAEIPPPDAILASPVERFVSHFATCENADDWRKK